MLTEPTSSGAIVTDLQQWDDAQVIFETFNAHGKPLLPADLLHKCGANKEPRESLFEEARHLGHLSFPLR